jgi:alpha-tubulin suppressor-like RCC1 family protein
MVRWLWDLLKRLWNMAISIILNNPTAAIYVPPPANRELYSWGLNANYQAGNNTNTSPLTTPTVASGANSFIKVARHDGHVLAIKEDGTLWAWGLNTYGQLGLNDTTTRQVPTQVGVDTNWSDISVGAEHSAALKSTGALYLCGRNSSGQLGLGDNTDRDEFTQFVGHSFTKVSCGYDPFVGAGTLALKADGSVFYAGDRTYNQHAGAGGTANAFIQIASSSYNFTEIVCAGIYNLAIDNTGLVWGVGYNSEGQLGVGDNAPKAIWTAQSGAHLFTKLAPGFRCTLALKSDGSVRGWGRSATLIFGLDGAGDNNAPQLVQNGPYEDIAVTVGWSGNYQTGFGIDSGGLIKAWGNNINYEFGTGSNTPSESGTAVAAAGNVAYVALPKTSGYGAGMALKE